MSERRTVLVTGASSGIGAAFADVFASQGFDAVITARRQDRLHALSGRLVTQYGVRVHVVPADLTEPDAAAGIWREIDRRGLHVDALVNSAGFGLPGTYAASAWPGHQAMLQLMVVAVSELTYRALPGMIERRYGRIVNVGSIAGVVQVPAGALYGAAKTFVVRFSESLAAEVLPHGIHVTAICPGLTATGFHDAPELRATVNGMPSWMWMDPATVARQGFDAVMAGRRVHVNGGVNRAMVTLFRYAPLPLLKSIGRRVTRAYRRVSA